MNRSWESSKTTWTGDSVVMAASFALKSATLAMSRSPASATIHEPAAGWETDSERAWSESGLTECADCIALWDAEPRSACLPPGPKRNESLHEGAPGRPRGDGHGGHRRAACSARRAPRAALPTLAGPEPARAGAAAADLLRAAENREIRRTSSSTPRAALGPDEPARNCIASFACSSGGNFRSSSTRRDGHGHHRVHHPRFARRLDREGDHARQRPWWIHRDGADRNRRCIGGRLPRGGAVRRRPAGRVLRHFDLADGHRRVNHPARVVSRRRGSWQRARRSPNLARSRHPVLKRVKPREGLHALEALPFRGALEWE